MVRMEGVTGTIGSGKGTLANYLAEKYGYLHLEVRKFLKEELQRRPTFHADSDERVRLQLIANELRREHGPGYVVDQLCQIGIASGRDFIIESIRCIGEVETLSAYPEFRLWATDADREIRYERVVLRKGATDAKTFEQFCADEDREMHSTNKGEQNLRGCIELAHIQIENNLDLDVLYSEIDRHMLRGSIEARG